jgi:hypothetical protein
MDTQRGESLSSALREADVRQRRLLGCVQNVVDGIRDIVESEIIDAEIPELLGIRWVVDGFFRVFIATIISELSPHC